MTTDSQRQEKRWALVHGGFVNNGSGNTTGHKNDVRTGSHSIELKFTAAKSYSVKLADLQRGEKEAIIDDRRFLFGLEFKNHTGGNNHRYVIMSEDDYLAMKEDADAHMRACFECSSCDGYHEYGT